MLLSLLPWIRAAYVKPSGFYPEQTEREPLIPTHPPPVAAGSLQPPSKESFATSLQPQQPSLLKHKELNFNDLCGSLPTQGIL